MNRRLGSTIRAIPRLGLQGAQPLNQLPALGPPRVRDTGPVLGGLDPHPALPGHPLGKVVSSILTGSTNKMGASQIAREPLAEHARLGIRA